MWQPLGTFLWGLLGCAERCTAGEASLPREGTGQSVGREESAPSGRDAACAVRGSILEEEAGFLVWTPKCPYVKLRVSVSISENGVWGS